MITNQQSLPARGTRKWGLREPGDIVTLSRMRTTVELIDLWFAIWNGEGEVGELPIAADFRHVSPYGTIEGKGPYMQLVASNRDKFLGNRIVVHDSLLRGDAASIRYTVSKGDFSMEVTEWIYCRDGLISEIIAYYNIEGEISNSRTLDGNELFNE